MVGGLEGCSDLRGGGSDEEVVGVVAIGAIFMEVGWWDGRF